MLCKSFVIDDIHNFDKSKLDKLNMAFFSCEKQISLPDELREPKDTKKLAQLSADAQTMLFVNFIATISDKRYLSVMVIDKGKIIGVSDCLTRKDFFSSNNQRIYMMSDARAGVIVDQDILYAESVRSLFVNNADFIVFMTFENYNRPMAKSLNAHKNFNDLPVLAVFNDCLCGFFDKVIKKEKENTIYIDIKENNYKKNLIKKFSETTFEY